MGTAGTTLSIIVLTYNRQRLLRDCLQSLVVQVYPQDRLEIVVSDDGSRDETQELVACLQTQHPHIRTAISHTRV